MTARCANCKIKLIMITFLCLFIFGCITIETKGERTVIDPWKKIEEKIADFWKKLKGEKTEEQVGTREEATKKYEYKGFKEELIVEPPIITPKVVKPGDIVKQELRYTLLAPQKDRQFNISETVSLSSGKETFEIMERSSKKVQGIHLCTVKFTIPADLNPGVYTLITILNIGEQKKTVSESFKLIETGYNDKPTLSTTTPKEIGILVIGNLWIDSKGKFYLMPLAVYRDGKYLSTYFVSGSEKDAKSKEAIEIKQILHGNKTFTLYDKGTFVGRFEVTGTTLRITYPDCGGNQLVATGSPLWEKGYAPTLPETRYYGDYQTGKIEGIVALSQTIAMQPFWLKRENLTKEQTSRLDKLLHSTLTEASVSLENKGYKEIRQAVVKAPDSHSVKVMDLDNDRQAEVYLASSWKKLKLYTNIFATWKESDWKIIRKSTYISSESLPTVGDVPFYPELLADIDGDGIVELILEERIGYEVWSLKLYKLRDKQLEKVLDIAEYGL